MQVQVICTDVGLSSLDVLSQNLESHLVWDAVLWIPILHRMFKSQLPTWLLSMLCL